MRTAPAATAVLAAIGLAAVWIAGGGVHGSGPAQGGGGAETGTTTSAGVTPGILGFHRDRTAAQRSIEAALLKLADPARIEKHHAALTRAPHVAGTPGNAEVQRYIEGRFREAGIETTTRSYSVHMGFVKEAALEMVAPEAARLATPEPAVPGDPQSGDPQAALNWHAYSPSADFTREVIYVHHARPEDFARLEALGISVKDRLVLARNFKGYRGGKVLEARRRGAAGLILFSDPAEDGSARGPVYPDGPWGPDTHIQRGSTALDFFVPGDPLTPGWASVAGARRIDPADAVSLPRLPSIPISARDAAVILKHLGGPRAPDAWQGGLDLPYNIGPGPARLRLRIVAESGPRTITNVIGVLRGTDDPARSILLSNHHDAWLFGGTDPSSGTATMLELARVAGELARRGFRPRRTLVFGSWDAEEWTLTGSTEYGEEMRDDLAANGVACLNVDHAANGPDFQATTVPTLRRFITEVLRDVPDPGSGASLLAHMAAAGGEGAFRSLYGNEADRAARQDVRFDLLGSGSDYTVFFNHLGMPSIDASFDGPYGVYHSVYDSHQWLRRFGDPGFVHHATMVGVWGTMAWRMANADLLPFEEGPYPADLGDYLDDLAKAGAGSKAIPDLGPLRAATADWAAAAGLLDAAIRETMAGPPPPAAALAAANALLMQAERDLLRPEGIPGRPWYRHLVYAPLPTYAAETVPGIREAVLAGDRRRARAQTGALVAAVRARTATIRRAADALRGGVPLQDVDPVPEDRDPSPPDAEP